MPAQALIAALVAGLVVSIAGGFAGVLSQLRRAQFAELTARRAAYAADMNLVQPALDSGDLGRARELLDRHRPGRESSISAFRSPFVTDLRGWEWRYLWARSRGDENVILCRYSNAVSVLAFSRDGKQLAVARDNGEGALWDAPERRLQWELPLGSRNPAMALSPAGDLVARGETTVADGAFASLRDRVSQREIARLPHSHAILSIAFSPQGDELAALAFDGTVRVWNVSSGQIVRRLSSSHDDPSPGRYSMVTNALEFEPMWSNASQDYGRVLFSPDGRWLILGEARPRIRLVDRATTNERVIALGPPADGVTALALSADGRWLAAGGGWADRRVHVWDLENPGAGTDLALVGHDSWITGLAFSPDGADLASVSRDRTLCLWALPKGDLLRRFQGSLEGLVSVAWSPDGRKLVTGGTDGAVRIWNHTVPPLPPFLVMPPVCVVGHAFPPDDNAVLAVLRSDGSVRRWEVRWDSPAVVELEHLSFLETNHTCLDLSRDGRWLALGDWKGNVRIWDLPARRQIAHRTIPDARVFVVWFSPGGHFLNVGAMSPEDRVLSRFWESPDWREVLALDLAFDEFTGFAFSPDDRTVGLGFKDGTAAWHDLRSGHRETFEPCVGGGVRTAFSPDGRWFAMVGENGLFTLWDVATRRRGPVRRIRQIVLYWAAFSPDSRRLMVSGADPNAVVRVLDVESGNEMPSLADAPGRLFSRFGFSPDGNTLFAVSPWGPTLLWCAPSWEEIEREETRLSQEKPPAARDHQPPSPPTPLPSYGRR